jgi:hypothetical protein
MKKRYNSANYYWTLTIAKKDKKQWDWLKRYCAKLLERLTVAKGNLRDLVQVALLTRRAMKSGALRLISDIVCIEFKLKKGRWIADPYSGRLWVFID